MPLCSPEDMEPSLGVDRTWTESRAGPRPQTDVLPLSFALVRGLQHPHWPRADPKILVSEEVMIRVGWRQMDDLSFSVFQGQPGVLPEGATDLQVGTCWL